MSQNQSGDLQISPIFDVKEDACIFVSENKTNQYISNSLQTYDIDVFQCSAIYWKAIWLIDTVISITEYTEGLRTQLRGKQQRKFLKLGANINLLKWELITHQETK